MSMESQNKASFEYEQNPGTEDASTGYQVYRQPTKPDHKKKGRWWLWLLIAGVVALIIVIVALSATGEHQHIWKEATCTEARTCKDCGETTGAALNHQWADATCQLPRSCQRCGITTGTVLGHNWTAATTQAPQTCMTCGATQGRSLGTALTKCTLIEDTNEKGSKTDVCAGNWNDCLGATHKNALRFWVVKQSGWSNTESAVYALDKQYQEIEVSVQLEQNSQDGATAYVKIYLDGKLEKTSAVVKRDSSAVKFTLNVSGANQIRVECVTDTAKQAYCIVDAMLYVQ